MQRGVSEMQKGHIVEPLSSIKIKPPALDLTKMDNIQK